MAPTVFDIEVCPECNAKLGDVGSLCPNCGCSVQKHAEHPGPPARVPFAYSPLADLALLVNIIAAFIGCAIIVVGIPVMMYKGEWLAACLYFPIAFLLEAGLLVLFLRARHQ